MITLRLIPQSGRPIRVHAAVSATPQAIRQGLAGVAAAHAYPMLFDLRNDPRAHTFTTVGMLFPLDFALLHAGRVYGLQGNVAPGVPAVFTTLAEFILETPAGMLPPGLLGGRYAFEG